MLFFPEVPKLCRSLRKAKWFDFIICLLRIPKYFYRACGSLWAFVSETVPDTAKRLLLTPAETPLARGSGNLDVRLLVESFKQGTPHLVLELF